MHTISDASEENALQSLFSPFAIKTVLNSALRLRAINDKIFQTGAIADRLLFFHQEDTECGFNIV